MKINAGKIQVLMAERRLNQHELGKMAGITRQSISSILRRGSAQPKTVGKLADGLGVSVDEIIMRSDAGQNGA